MGLLSEIFRFGCRSAFFLALAFVQVRTQAEEAGTVDSRLEGGGRTITLTAPGLSGFRGSFSATVVIGGVTNVLSSDFGTLVGTNSFTAETTPYGLANVSLSTIRFEIEQIELLFRMDKVAGVPGVLLQAGIRNLGPQAVNLISVAPLAMGGEEAPGRSRAMSAIFSSGGLVAPALLGGFVVAGNPAHRAS